MIRLVYSNRFEGLADALADAIAVERTHDPLGFVDVVVANPTHHDALRVHVADRHGGWGAVRVHHLRAFLAESVRALTGLEPMDATAWTRRLAAAIAARTDPADAPADLGADDAALAEWLGEDPDGRRAVELAARLGRLFDEYALSRLDLAGAWSRGRAWAPASGTRAAGMEPWQRALWMRALALGPAAERPLHEGILALPEATVDVTAPRAGAPRSPVHLFAVSAGGSRPVIEALRRIGMQRDVHVYAFNPCLEFWEDVDTRHRLGPDGLAHASAWARRKGAQRRLDLDLDDPFGLAEPGDTPLLRLLGRPGREVVRLMGTLTDCDFEPRFARADAPDASLLARLQTDVLERQPERAPCADRAGRPADASVRFVPAPDARSELDAVAARIRADLDAHPVGARTCAVLVPEGARDRYLPLAAEALAAVGVPATVIGERLVDTSPIARLARDLLRWLDGRMDRSTLRRVLLSEVLADAGPGVADAARRWLDELHVTVGDAPIGDAPIGDAPIGDASNGGSDTAPSAHTDANSDAHMDARQIDRAATRAGWAAFVDPVDGADENEALGWPTGRGPVAPFARAAGDPETAARVVRVVRRLVADRDALREGAATLPEHADRLARLLEHHVVAEGGAALEARVRCVQALRDVAAAFAPVGDAPALRAPLDAVLERFAAAIDGLDHRSAGRVDGGVVVGPMDALRGLPFDVIHVVGLDAGVVPRPSGGDPLDVRTVRRVAGDVTPAERERYRFLEALLAARACFVLSWVDRDPSSGEPRPPSPLVDELRWVVRGWLDADALAALHTPAPAAPWDPKVWAATDAAAATPLLPAPLRDVAIVAAARRVPRAEWPDDVAAHVAGAAAPVALPSPPPSGAAGTIEVRLADLVRYLRSPLQATARVALGLRDDAPVEDADVVPLTTDRWTDMALDDAIREALTGGRDVDAAVLHAWRRLDLRGALPPGPFGRAALARATSRTRAIDDAVRAVGLPGMASLHATHVGRPDRADDLGDVLPALVVDAPLLDGTSARVRLVGTVPRGHGDALVRTRARRGRAAEASVRALRDLPRLVVGAAALVASGRAVRRVLSVPAPLEDGDAERVAYRVAWDAPAARDWLATVAGGLISGFDPARRPIELALARAGLGDPRHADLELSELEAELSRGGRLSDAWGPIEDPAAFDLAPVDRLERWMDRALAPVLAIAATRGPA